MATIDIGKLTFTHKGDYAGGTAYVANDVVYYNGSAYIAKQSTTGNVPTNTTYWSTFAAGSGGIWNSGLSIGSAGQVVKVNSGASALEFGNEAGGGLRFISNHNLTSNSAEWIFDQIMQIRDDFVQYIAPVAEYLNEQTNKSILFEGAQGSMLDVDFGTYPYVTSSNTLAGMASVGSGMPHNKIHDLLGIT